MRDLRIIELATSAVWAILPSKMAVIASVLSAHAAGAVRITSKEAAIEAAHRRDARSGSKRDSVIGVVPIHGTILPRGDALTEASGITTTEQIRSSLSSLVADDSVGAIVLDIDSPGGVVQGVPETANAIFAARGSKPIIAQVWDLAASAGYWLASQADEVVVTQSGEVGSIGVRAMHVDVSRALENDGVKVTNLTAGKHKAELSPFAPLSDDARIFQQAALDAIHDEFIDAVARGRAVKSSRVREDFGQGRIFRAGPALQAGMVDAVGTFDGTVGRLAADIIGRRSALSSDATLRLRRLRYAAEIGDRMST